MIKIDFKITLALRLMTLFLCVIVLPEMRAGSAQWLTSPSSGDWNTGANWNPATVPNGSSDVATFGTSSTTSISTSANTEVAQIVFNAGASAYTIIGTTAPSIFFPSFTLTISGTGITNNSGISQNFLTVVDTNGHGGTIMFSNSASAGDKTIFTNSGSTNNLSTGGQTLFTATSNAGSASITNSGGAMDGGFGGLTKFSDSSSASSANIFNEAGAINNALEGLTYFMNTSTAGSSVITNDVAAAGIAGEGGSVHFFNSSTAGSATIVNNGSSSVDSHGGTAVFIDNTSAGTATITNHAATVSGFFPAGKTQFEASSTAAAATLIADGTTGDGGSIYFQDDSTGGTSRIEVFGKGKLDISSHNAPGVTVGSIEGTGRVFLGSNTLTVGSNNLSTTFSGTIQDGGLNSGTGGSLKKSGTGTLTLTGASTYTGNTMVTDGTLLVSNTSGSGTGTSTVRVNGGTLGGAGTIAGAVIVGTNTASIISPGASVGTLTIQNTLTLNSNATYKFELNSSSVLADKIVANGITITGAKFSFTDLGSGHLAVGTSFVIIDNTSSSAITGFFTNLADGSTFTNNGNAYLVSYEGGNGNDLTITVVPEPSAFQLLILSIAFGLGFRQFFHLRRAPRKISLSSASR